VGVFDEKIAQEQTSTLTGKLEAVTAAEKAQTNALTALNDELTKIGVSTITAKQAEIDALADQVELAILGDKADLIEARNEAADSLIVNDSSAQTAVNYVIGEISGKAADAPMSDALLAELKTKVQALIDADTALYDITTPASTAEIVTPTEIYQVTTDGKAPAGNGSNVLFLTGAQVGGKDVFASKVVYTITFSTSANENDEIEVTIGGVKYTIKAIDDTGFDGWDQNDLPADYVIDSSSDEDTLIITTAEAGIDFEVDLVAVKAATGGAAVISVPTPPAFTVFLQPADIYGYAAAANAGTGVVASVDAIASENVKTMAQMQTAIADAKSALATHTAAMGNNEAILTSLQALLADYATVGNAGKAFNDIFSDGSVDIVAELVAAVDDALKAVSSTYSQSDRDTAINTLVTALKNNGTATEITDKTGSTDNAASVNSFLADIAEIDVLEGNLADAESAFANATDAGNVTLGDYYNEISALIQDRNELKEAVANADATKSTIDALIDALQAKMGELSDAKADLGFDVQKFEAKLNYAGTDADDLFIYNTDITAKDFKIGSLKAGDALFLDGYAYNAGDISKDGDHNALEFFVTKSGANTVITYETDVFGSATGDHKTITLTGVADVSVEDGVILVG